MDDGMEYGKSERFVKTLEIITALNKQNRQGENRIFDCGKLGFVHIWWRKGWEWEWMEPSIEFKAVVSKDIKGV